MYDTAWNWWTLDFALFIYSSFAVKFKFRIKIWKRGFIVPCGMAISTDSPNFRAWRLFVFEIGWHPCLVNQITMTTNWKHCFWKSLTWATVYDIWYICVAFWTSCVILLERWVLIFWPLNLPQESQHTCGCPLWSSINTRHDSFIPTCTLICVTQYRLPESPSVCNPVTLWMLPKSTCIQVSLSCFWLIQYLFVLPSLANFGCFELPWSEEAVMLLSGITDGLAIPKGLGVHSVKTKGELKT